VLSRFRAEKEAGGQYAKNKPQAPKTRRSSMTVMTARPTPVPITPEAPFSDEQHLVLYNLSWESYLGIGLALSDRPALRLTYDRGTLEFMTTSRRHEFFKKWLNRFVETMAEELDRPIEPGGNMTFQRQDLARGLEGDECFWIEHEPEMRGKQTWDAGVDPPPDLFLEVEVSRTVVDRLAILAALEVPEVWTFDGTAIRVHHLQANGTYELADKSRFFPEIPLGELARFIGPEGTDYLTAIRKFRAWVRQILGKPPSPEAE
jgi:hypothetical protein